MANTRREEVNAPEMVPRQIELQRAFATPSEAGGASVGGAADSAAASFNGAAKLFAQVSDTIGRYADEVAIDKGRKEGAIAGFDPEFRPKGGVTLYAKAYDQAAVQTYKGQMTVNLAGQMEKAFDAHKDNPAKLATALQGIRQGWMENIDRELAPHVLPEFEASFNRQALTLNRQATKNQLALAAQAQHATLLQSLAVHQRAIDQAAYGNGLDPAADAALAGELQSYQAKLSQRGADGRYLLEPATQFKLLRDMEEQIVAGRLYGAFDRLPSLQEKQALIRKLDEDFAKSQGGAAKLDLPQFMKIKSRLETEYRRAEHEGREASALIGAQVTRVEQDAAVGKAATPDEMVRLRTAAAATGDLKLQARLALAENTLAYTQDFLLKPPAVQDAELKGLRERAADPKRGIADWESHRLIIAEKLAGERKTKVVEDPLGYAHASGLTKVTPLDFSTPETTAATLQTRVTQAEQVAAYYGQKPVYLRPLERQALQADLAKGGDAALATAGQVALAFGDKAEAVMNELDKQHNGQLALMGMHVVRGADPQFLKDAAVGLALRKDPERKTVAHLKNVDVDAAAAKVDSGVMGAFPQARSAAINLTNAAYEVVAQRQGLTAFDEAQWQSLYRQAIGEQLVGGEVYGGLGYARRSYFGWRLEPVIVPHNVKQAGFGELLQAIQLEDFGGNGPVHQHGKPVTVSDFDGAGLLQAGDGRYYLQTGTASDGRPRVLQTRDGRDFVLDLKALEPVLRKRRPDLYRGPGPASSPAVEVVSP